ncbi:MAG: Bug family tripartite tricarboxylate transporter substrate binding protein [Candidatus Binatia bacterium]
MHREVSYVAKLIIVVALMVCAPATSLAGDFYKGKTLRFIVGASPGGGYDTYTRLVARYIGKYIPGKPTTLVQNMTGAGMLIAANYVYRRARPDGLSLGIFNNSLIVQKAIGDPKIKINFGKMGWVGAPSVGIPVCMVMGFTGLRTLEDVLKYKKPLKVGATRAGSSGHDIPLILNKVLGTNFKVITGYRGTAPTRVALQRHELEAFCSQWESMRVTARSMLDAKGGEKLIPFIVHSRGTDPETKNLPLFREAIKGKKNLAVYNAWTAQMDFQRPLSLPPGTPKDRLKILRKGFEAALKDPQLLAEAKKSKLIITYVSGVRVEKLVGQILSMSQEVRESLEFLIRKKKGGGRKRS